MEKLPHLNGIFYAGGDASGDEYWNFAKQIYDYVKAQNLNGTFYPQWGTCLGMQDLVTFEASRGRKVESYHKNEDESANLFFSLDPKNSVLFKDFDDEDINAFKKQRTSYLVHHYGFTPKVFKKDKGLRRFFRFTSTQIDENRNYFVGSVEAKHYPFYGV